MKIEDRTIPSTSSLDGFASFLGIKIEENTDELVHVSLELKPEFLNPLGIPHGGILATMLDHAMGMLVYRASGMRRMVTRSADIHYLRASEDSVIHSYAHIISCGSRMCLACGEVKDSAGRILATGNFEFFFI